jgi:hypothetical protein
VTAATCEEKGGYFYGAGIDCTDPIVECETGDPGDEDGACCIDGTCTITNATKCWEGEGAFYGPGSDCDDAFVECCDDDTDADGGTGPVDADPIKGCSTSPSPIKHMLPVFMLAGIAMVTSRRRED